MNPKRSFATFPYHFADLKLSCPKEWLDATYTFEYKTGIEMFKDWLALIEKASFANRRIFESNYPEGWEKKVKKAHDITWIAKSRPLVSCELQGLSLYIRYLKFNLKTDEYSKFEWVMDWSIPLIENDNKTYKVSGHEIKAVVELISRSFSFYVWDIFAAEQDLAFYSSGKNIKNPDLMFLAEITDSDVLSEIIQVENCVLTKYKEHWVISDLEKFWNFNLNENEILSRWEAYKEEKKLNFKVIEDVFSYFYAYRRQKVHKEALMTELNDILILLRGDNLVNEFKVTNAGLEIKLWVGHKDYNHTAIKWGWADLLNNPASKAKTLLDWQAQTIGKVAKLVNSVNKDISSMFDLLNSPLNTGENKFKLIPLEAQNVNAIWGSIFIQDHKVWVQNELETQPTNLGITHDISKSYLVYWRKLEEYVEMINKKIESNPEYKVFLNKNLFWNEF